MPGRGPRGLEPNSTLAVSRSLSPDEHTMIGRMVGIIRRPRATFQAVAADPRWIGVLAALFLIGSGVNALFLSTAVGQQALVDQWERTALAFGQDVDDARYGELQELSRRGPTYAILTQLARGPVLAIGLAALLYGSLGRRRGAAPAFRQVLAVVAYSTVILALREIMAAPINFARESITSPTTLVQLFPVANAASPVARFFGLIDVFVVWWLAVLAVGLGVLYARRAWPIAATLYGVYAGVAAALAATMALLGGTI